MEWLRMESWSPYVVGIGIGILSWISFAVSDKPLGCSTAFARTAGMLERLFRGKKVDHKPYYRKFAPAIDWEWMLVLGVIIGAFVSAKLSGEFALEWVPGLWQAEVGSRWTSGPAARWVVALLGGVIMGIGARWAGGCTSGHGISGMLQLAVSSWLAATSFFVGGIMTAMVIFKVLL
jgi:uncharacterized membrane protein YedE/YeeE